MKQWTRADKHIAPALGAAAVVFKVSYRWLKACNNSEHGNTMGYNYEGSGAFGPMQFMWGTFYSNVRNAFAHARQLGHPVPFRFARIDSRVGQAITAAHMFRIGQSGQWTGSGC